MWFVKMFTFINLKKFLSKILMFLRKSLSLFCLGFPFFIFMSYFISLHELDLKLYIEGCIYYDISYKKRLIDCLFKFSYILLYLIYSNIVSVLKDIFLTYLKKFKYFNKESDLYFYYSKSLYTIVLNRIPDKSKDNIGKHKLIDSMLYYQENILTILEKLPNENNSKKVFKLTNQLLDNLKELNKLLREYDELN